MQITERAHRVIEPLLQAALIAAVGLRLEINLLPIRKYNESLPGLNISLMLLASLAALAVRALRRRRGEPRERIVPPAFGVLTVVLLVWCGVGLAGTSEIVLGFYSWFSLAACLLYTWMIAAEFGRRDTLARAVLLVACILGVNGLVGVLQGTVGWLTDIPALSIGKAENRQLFAGDTILRSVGLQVTANSFAWFLATLLPIVMAPVLLGVPALTARARRAMAGTAVIGMLALLLSYSRGGWLAYAATMLLLCAMALRSAAPADRRPVRRRLMAFALAGALLAAPFAGPIYTRLTEDDRGAVYTRIPLALVAIDMIAARPLRGVGLSEYEAEMRGYDRTPERISEDFSWPVHNIVLHQAAEIGVPGLAVFLALVGLAVREALLAARSRTPLVHATAIGLLCAMFAFFLIGMKEPGTLGSPQMRLCFLGCGLMLALGRVHRADAPGTERR